MIEVNNSSVEGVPCFDFLKPPLPFEAPSCLPLLRPPPSSITRETTAGIRSRSTRPSGAKRKKAARKCGKACEKVREILGGKNPSERKLGLELKREKKKLGGQFVKIEKGRIAESKMRFKSS